MSASARLLLAPLALALLVAAGGAPPLAAQPLAESDPSWPGGLPDAVVREVRQRWTAPGTRRLTGPFEIAAGDTVRGDVAVLGGPARIAGVLSGRLLVVDGPLVLVPGAVITGDVLVVGGPVDGRAAARLDGDLRAWRARLDARVSGDSLLIADAPDAVRGDRWERWRRGKREALRPWGDVFIATANTYNRVEGLPVIVGPRLRAPLGPGGRLLVEAFGIVRTGDRLAWTPENRGHRARVAFEVGSRWGAALEGQSFDEVDRVEPWTLPAREVGLAAVLGGRDYGDYFNRKGAAIALRAVAPGGLEAGVRLTDERWRSRAARDVWSLRAPDAGWRANPVLDEGRLHRTIGWLTLDTRNNPRTPRSGWWLSAEWEGGVGTLTSLGPADLGVREGARPGRATWSRGVLDVRRYNRLAPNTQLDVRLVVGSALSGTLPLARRFSAGGIDALPGFTFRAPIGGTDLATCGDVAATIAGRPAQCDGVALVQAEWRGEFSIGVPQARRQTDWFDWDGFDGAWVLFVNSGRGWLRGDVPAVVLRRDAASAGTGRWLGDASLPGPGSFRTDLGAGIDLGGVGVYVAVPVTSPGAGRTPTVFLRAGRRF